MPKCGSFQSSVEVAILPALAVMTEAEDMGRSQMDAMGDAIPLLLNATALTMPCREMCEAVVQTCRRAPLPSCGPGEFQGRVKVALQVLQKLYI